MPDIATRASPNARVRVPDRTGFAVAAAAGVLLAITGAFDTGPAPLWLRLGYWLTVMLSGALIGTAVTDLVHRWGRLARLPLVEGALIAFAIAAPLTLLVSGASVVAFGLRGFSLVGMGYMFLLVLMVSCIMVAINYLLAAQRRAGMAAATPAIMAPADSPAPPVATDAGSRFRARLPLHLRSAALRAVASEDHYLRVYTDAGEALILMRLADALAELEGVAGAQTHRSWWVAQGAVTAVERGAGKATLTLAGGVTAPVSRSFLPVLIAQGWR
jgi:hypothetical protein